MATKIQLRRDTSTNWTANNPVLSSGEVAFSTDLGKIKMGNGTANWVDLPYIHLTPAEASSLYQPLDSDLTAIAGLSASATGYAKKTGEGTWTVDSDYVASISGTENEVEVSASTGNITIGLPSTINANTTGNAATATSLQTARTISLGGDLSGSASFDGTSNITISASVDSQSSVNSITGTENEISVSASVGDITISLPNTINANTTGTAASLTTPRIIALSGDVSGSVTFDGSASVNIGTEIQPNSVALGTDTTGNYVATATAGSGISISGSGSENAEITISNTGVKSLTGTANQISVSASNGDPTISLPSAVTFPGTVTLNADPTQALQAATKQYVDAVAQGLHIHASVAAATTASVNLSDPPSSIDNVSLSNNMRILVKDQSNAAQNGIYVFNGSALVRADDYDTAGEVQAGDFVFVSGGDTYNSTGWVQENDVTTLGTDPIVWDQFSGAGTYSAGTGLALNGSVFSNTGVLSLAGTTNEVEVSASSGAITISLPSTINANTTGSAATLTTSRTIELTGDVTGSATFNGGANASITSTLADTAVTPATYGSASAVGTVTVDSKGRITGGLNTPISIAQSAVTNLTTDLAAKAPLASPTFTGTVSASAINISTADTATTASHYIVETGSDGVIRPKTLANVRTEIVTTNAVNDAAATTVGTVTSGTWDATNIALNRGGTNASLTAADGAVVYSTASALALTSVGTAGQVLTSNGAGAPTWQEPPSSGFDGFFLVGM